MDEHIFCEHDNRIDGYHRCVKCDIVSELQNTVRRFKPFGTSTPFINMSALQRKRIRPLLMLCDVMYERMSESGIGETFEQYPALGERLLNANVVTVYKSYDDSRATEWYFTEAGLKWYKELRGL